MLVDPEIVKKIDNLSVRVKAVCKILIKFTVGFQREK